MHKQLKKPIRNLKRCVRLTQFGLWTALGILIIVTGIVSRQKVIAARTQAETSVGATNKRNRDLVTVNVAGQDLKVDGQTGQIQPLTPEEARKLAAGLKQLVNQSTEGLVQVQHADGSVSMDLEGRFQNVTVARVDGDGSVTQSCVDNPRAAAAFFGIDPKLLDEKSNAAPRQNQTQSARRDRTPIPFPRGD